MNVVLPDKPKILNRRNVTYMTVFIICVVAVAIAVYQFFTEEKLDVILGITKVENEEINQLKQDFNNLFTNELTIGKKQKTIDNIQKISGERDLVYTDYEKEEKSLNNYEINVFIPQINIDNDITKKYNEEIKNSFQKPAEDILQTEERNIIYTVNYMSYVENDILSVVILATFKEQNNVQRTIAKAYNYNIKTNKEVTLDNFMKIKYLDKKILEEEIKKEIESEQEQTEQLKELGYNIFLRDVTDEMYKIENAENYFMYNGYLYVIYAYGNTNNTSEMDIIII